jgi:hypothetical protein
MTIMKTIKHINLADGGLLLKERFPDVHGEAERWVLWRYGSRLRALDSFESGFVEAALREALAEPAQEPFGQLTLSRLSQRFKNHVDVYNFYPAGQSPNLDNVDECYTVYTTPQPPAPAVECDCEELLAALTGCVHIIRNIGAGATTIEKQEADPESALNHARATIAAYEAKKKFK